MSIGESFDNKKIASLKLCIPQYGWFIVGDADHNASSIDKELHDEGFVFVVRINNGDIMTIPAQFALAEYKSID